MTQPKVANADEARALAVVVFVVAAVPEGLVVVDVEYVKSLRIRPWCIGLSY